MPESMKPSNLPMHLRDDAPFVSCSNCYRKSWSQADGGTVCNMTQPSGNRCKGRFGLYDTAESPKPPEGRKPNPMTASEKARKFYEDHATNIVNVPRVGHPEDKSGWDGVERAVEAQVVAGDCLVMTLAKAIDFAAKFAASELESSLEAQRKVMEEMGQTINRLLVHWVGQGEVYCPECGNEYALDPSCETCEIINLTIAALAHYEELKKGKS